MPGIPKQLIILGNGFDIACGLSSRYSDFYKSRAKYIHTIIGTDPLNAQANIWDYILKGSAADYEKWSSVEAGIRACLLSPRLPSSSNETEVMHIASTLRNWFNIIDTSQEDLPTQWFLFLWGGKESTIDNLSQPELIDRIDKYLLHSLEDYEQLFSNYLSRQLYSQPSNKPTHRYQSYHHNAYTVIMRLLNMLPTEVAKLSATSILNFNYTTPFANMAADGTITYGMGTSLQSCFNAYENVHGSLATNNAFFGIDGTGLLDNDNILPFTKTYRLMTSHLGLDQSSVLEDSDYKYIRVFGHSLGSADYAYFQSIFDDVDLYHSSTDFTVYYAPSIPHDQEDKYRQTVKLLTAYGKTLDNQEHGKNLIHKMLLENRLHVKEFDTRNLNLEK